MRKIFAVFLSVLIIMSLFVPAFADAAPSYDDSLVARNMTKAEFADYCDELASSKSRSVSMLSEEEILDLLGAYSMSTDEKRAEYESILNDHGCYIYSCTSAANTRSQPGDVSMGTVAITYIPYTQEWVVGFSGRWTSVDPVEDEWDELESLPEIDDTQNIGGLDAAGIIFYNTSGSTPNMLSSMCKVTNDGDLEYTTTSPSTYNSAQGVAFQYQDYARVLGYQNWLTEVVYDYLGHVFTVSMTFDSSFEFFNGAARGFYVHTWDQTSITSIGFSADVTGFGLDLSWSNEGYSFQCYSNSDTQF